MNIGDLVKITSFENPMFNGKLGIVVNKGKRR